MMAKVLVALVVLILLGHGKCRVYNEMPLMVEKRSSHLLGPTGFDQAFSRKSIQDSASRDDKHYLLFVAIKIRAENYDRRNLLRSTLLSLPFFKGEDRTAVAKFYIGRTPQLDFGMVKQEMELYDDLVLFDLEDRYENISSKVFAIRDYALTFYSFDYFLELDDDVYINMYFVVEMVRSLEKEKYYYIGAIFENDLVNRDENSRHYLSKEKHPNDLLPPWAGGPAVILSASLLRRMFVERPFEHFEIIDVGTGLMVENIEDVEYIIPEGWLILARSEDVSEASRDKYGTVKGQVNCLHWLTEHEILLFYQQFAQEFCGQSFTEVRESQTLEDDSSLVIPQESGL